MLFGKIQGSDVLDVANHTLEEEVLKELIGSRCSYTAVLTADKGRTSAIHDERTDEWLVDHLVI